jgi:hypothetical protein
LQKQESEQWARTVVVGVGEERDDVRVPEPAEQAELLPERAQAPLAAAPAVHLDGDGRAAAEPCEVHGAGAAAAHDGGLVEPARQGLHLPPRQPPRLLLLLGRRRSRWRW